MRPTNETFYAHIRNIDPQTNSPSGKGGATIAFRQSTDGVVYTIARCNDIDNFNKRIGRAIAQGRLAKNKGVGTLQVDYSNMAPGDVTALVIDCAKQDLNRKKAWSIEATQDLVSQHGVNIEREMSA